METPSKDKLSWAERFLFVILIGVLIVLLYIFFICLFPPRLELSAPV
jgi:hypothetical protein